MSLGAATPTEFSLIGIKARVTTKAQNVTYLSQLSPSIIIFLGCTQMAVGYLISIPTRSRHQIGEVFSVCNLY